MKILFRLILVLALATRQVQLKRLREIVLDYVTSVLLCLRENQGEIAERRY